MTDRTTERDALPELPEPTATRCDWDMGWTQYHDEYDPLPQKWDDRPDHITPLYTADQMRAYAEQARSRPSAPEWRPIAEAPENMTECVVVRWIDAEGNERHDLDYTEDGCWMGWHDHAEHVEVIGGHGVSYTPPYTHFLALPAAPKEGEPR